MAGAFTEAQQARFDEELKKIVARYPPDRKSAAMLPALRLSQEILGYITPEAMKLCAERLEVAPARAEEVATFYFQFHTQPKGRHLIEVCTNISCSLCGGERVLEYLEKKLNIKSGQTTSDKRFTLREVECLASCGTAPVMQVNDEFVENLTPSKIDQALAKLT